MRVLVIGNEPRYLTNMRAPLLTAMVRLGHEVHAFAPDLDGELLRRVEAFGVRGASYPLQRNGTNPLADVRTIASLVRGVADVAPDVVFTYTIKPLLYGALASRLAHVKRRVAMVTGLGSTFNSDEIRGVRRHAVHLVAREMYRQALRQQDVVFFQNPDDEARFRGLGLVSRGQDVQRVNGSGIDLERFAFSPPPPPGGPVTYTLVARLHRQKGIREFVAAARNVRRAAPETKFVLIGPTEQHRDAVTEGELKEWVAAGIIDYRGLVDDVRPLLRETSVFVLPSYYPEGTPRSVLEALAIGRAVVTTDSPGCRETVVEGENGFLVPVRNAEVLTDRLMRFVADPALAARMGEAGRRLAETKFDVNEVNRSLLHAMQLA